MYINTEVKCYEIGGVVFEQRYPVMGQLLEVAELLAPLSAGTDNPAAVLRELGDRQFDFIAILLCPQGICLIHRNVEEIAQHLRNHLRATTAQEAVRDFFDWEGLVEEIAAVNSVRAEMAMILMAGQEVTAPAGPDGSDGANLPTDSPTSSPSCAQETSPGATPSSGDSPCGT